MDDFPVCFGNFEPGYYECLCCEYAGSCIKQTPGVLIPGRPQVDGRDE